MNIRAFLVPSWLIVTLGALCAGCGDNDSFPPEPEYGPCGCRIDGDTVDIVKESTVLHMNGSTLGIGCRHIETHSTRSRLEISIKAFNGPGRYTLDNTYTYGSIDYYGNDGLGYGNFSNDPAVGCIIDISEGSPEPGPGDEMRATFRCNTIDGYDNNGGFNYVTLTDGYAEGTFD